MTRVEGEPRWLRRAEKGLLAAAAILLAAAALAGLGGRVYQAYGARVLERAQGGDGGERPDAVGPGGVVGRIEIPRVGLSTVVREGTGATSLLLGVGHLRGSAFPGAPGQTVLAGHRDTFFRPLERVTAGDLVRIDTLRGAFAYRVVSARVVDPDQIPVQNGSATSSLLLVTCYPFDYVGPAPKRFVVLGAAALPEGG